MTFVVVGHNGSLKPITVLIYWGFIYSMFEDNHTHASTDERHYYTNTTLVQHSAATSTSDHGNICISRMSVGGDLAVSFKIRHLQL